MNKKAMTSTATGLIIFLVVLIVFVYIGTQLMMFFINQGVIGTCTAATLGTNGAESIKKTGIFRSYEVNCQAQHYTFTTKQLAAQKVTKDMALRTPMGESLMNYAGDSPARMSVILQDKMAAQLQSCWQITGIRKITDIRYTPAVLQDSIINEKIPGVRDYTEDATNFWFDYEFVVGSEQRAATKVQLLKKYLNYDVMPQTIIGKMEKAAKALVGAEGDAPWYLDRTTIGTALRIGSVITENSQYADMPAVACMICSTSHFGQTLEKELPETINLTPYLEKKPFKSTVVQNLSGILTFKKNGFPLQEVTTNEDHSVIYYQLYESPSQEVSAERLGVLVLPTSQVSNFCDVMLNRG